MSEITKSQRRALEEYAALSIGIGNLRAALRGAVEFDFRDEERRLTSHWGTPWPPVRIGLSHIRNAMDKHARGEITTRELAEWATMLLLNDAYSWSGSDEDAIADWLSDISGLTLKRKPHPGSGEG